MRLRPCLILCALFLLASILAPHARAQRAVDRSRVGLHKSNYIMFYSNDGNENQLKFQFSIGASLIDPIHLRMGYTQKSFWDIWDDSSPFREHNFNPEVFFRWTEEDGLFRKAPPFFRDHVERLDTGWEHVSTGVAGLSSRSWDRVFVEPGLRFRADQGLNLRVAGRLWYVFKDAPENRDILEYTSFTGRLGGKLRLSAAYKDRFRGSFEAGYSYVQLELAYNLLPRWRGFLLYAQLWTGKGDGLVGYDEHTQSAGIGISLIEPNSY